MPAIDPYDPIELLVQKGKSIPSSYTKVFDESTIHQTVYDMTLNGKLQWVQSPNWAIAMISSAELEEVVYKATHNQVPIEIVKHRGMYTLRMGGYPICSCSDKLYDAVVCYVNNQTNTHKMEIISQFFS